MKKTERVRWTGSALKNDLKSGNPWKGWYRLYFYSQDIIVQCVRLSGGATPRVATLTVECRYAECRGVVRCGANAFSTTVKYTEASLKFANLSKCKCCQYFE